MPMMYRSPLTRWLLALVGIAAGLLVALGPPHMWRSAPSFRWLAQLPIPLQLWGWAFVAYGVMLLIGRVRPVAYAVGAFLYAVFTVSLLATVNDGGPKNALAIAAMFDTVVFHAFSIRTAWAQRLAGT